MTEDLDYIHVGVDKYEFTSLMDILSKNKHILWQSGCKPYEINRDALFDSDECVFINLSNTDRLGFTRSSRFDKYNESTGGKQVKVSLSYYLQLLEKKKIITRDNIKEERNEIISADPDLCYVRLDILKFKWFMALLEKENKWIRWGSGYKPTEIPLNQLPLTLSSSIYVCVHSNGRLGYISEGRFNSWDHEKDGKVEALELSEYIFMLKNWNIIPANYDYCLTNKNITDHEIKFQNKRAFITGGDVPAGNCICGRRGKASMELGCLSYSKVIGS